MKKFSSYKGFTLVELMIVIAIIGILAAVLYPSMTGYFERSRDTNRQKALANVTLAIGTYYGDNSAYPGSTTSKCLDDIQGELLGQASAGNGATTSSGIQYMKAKVSDPNAPKFGVEGCISTTGGAANTATSGYGYKQVNSGGAFVMAARMENRANGNFKASAGLTGANAKGWSQVTKLEDVQGSLQAAKNVLKNEGTATDWYYVVAQ